MAGLSVIGILAVAAVGLATLRENLVEDRKAKLQDLVQVARHAVEFDYQASRKVGLSDAETLTRSKALLRSMRFGKDDYVYAIDKKGVTQSHPNPKVEGRNMIAVKDSDGVYFSRDLINAAAAGGGFVAFKFPRVGANEPLPKISYSLEFKPYGWAISAGIYIDDVNAIFWSQVRRVGAPIGFALIIVIGMLLMLGRSIVKPITGMTVAMRKLAGGDTATVVPAQDRRDEVGAMS